MLEYLKSIKIYIFLTAAAKKLPNLKNYKWQTSFDKRCYLKQPKRLKNKNETVFFLCPFFGIKSHKDIFMYIFKFSIFGVKCIRSLKTYKSLFSINQPCNRNKERSSHHIIFAFVQKRKSLLYLVEFLSVFFCVFYDQKWILLLFYFFSMDGIIWKRILSCVTHYFSFLYKRCAFFLFYIQFSFHFDSRNRVENKKKN